MGASLYDAARQGNVVVLAGAGLSAVKPSALPAWIPLQQEIVAALRNRLESALDRPDWLKEMVPFVSGELNARRFPPEYQAQLIAEMCGEHYFHALKALNIDIVNAGHDGIAALAKAGALKAVVTTNFDRLIEQALDRRGVQYKVAYDDASFAEMSDYLRSGAVNALPVVKIHGCVSAHQSMIDTLKQRRLGRAEYLQRCLDALQASYWLYLGFSASDLEGNPDYLGLVNGARRSEGATYISYRSPDLGKGAQILMDAFGERGENVVSDIPIYLGQVCSALGVSGPAAIPEDEALGPSRVQAKLQEWADTLSPAAAGLCLAAIFEAVGQAETAVRVLDRLVRKEELQSERDTPDFRALQLHYGRLGASWGRFIAVPDLNGAASNASVETVQSLFRVQESEVGFAASSWLALVWLWLDHGDTAMQLARQLLRGFVEGKWVGTTPRSDEEAVDAWLSVTQVLLVNGGKTTVEVVHGTASLAIALAMKTGDAVRVARVAALHLLGLAETTEDISSRAKKYQAEFDEAARVGDGFALGMRSLALGRWHVGAGGLALGRNIDPATVARQALEHLQQAIKYFEYQGMDPWVVFSWVQAAKAYADLHQFDEAQECINADLAALERFPVFASHIYEAEGQIQTMVGDPAAKDTFHRAIQAAGTSGLYAKQEALMRYVRSNE